jgi:anti-sigma factor RsiW
MKQHNPELVSAYVDGELHGLRRWLFERHLHGCLACGREFRHVQHVRRMLAANPPPAGKMDDAPEFFWSKVKREIEARGPATITVPEPALVTDGWLRGHVPALASAAVVALLVVTGFSLYRLRSHSTTIARLSPEVMQAATKIPDTAATTIAGKDEDVTVIWVTGLPWTPDMTEMQTLYAQIDT